MTKLTKALLILLPAFAYLKVYLIPYAVWFFALTQNWFSENGLILYRDVIYHHTPLPLFFLFSLAKFLGNTPEMLRFASFILTIFFGYGVYLTGKQISQKTGDTVLPLFFITFLALFDNFNIEEMFASLLSLYTVFFFLKFWQNRSFAWLFLAGFFTALGLMSKQVAIGIVPALMIATWWYLSKNLPADRQGRKLSSFFLKGSSSFLLGFSLAITPFILYYFFNQALADFFYWNFTFNLTAYPQQSTPYALKEGFQIGSWLFLAIIPAALLWRRGGLKAEMRFKLLVIILAALFLLPSLLPSFLGYKILAFYPYPLLLWAILWQFRRKKLIIPFLIAGLILFLIPAKPFYLHYFPQNLFQKELIIDYGENELKVVDWLLENTTTKEKIMNLGHHYITTLAQRLPANKYVTFFPWLVMPYDQSTKAILADPPRVVILDNQTILDFPILNQWPFLSHLRSDYQVVATYGTYEIFIPKKS